MTHPRPCPCGGGLYAECCEPFHEGRGQAPTAEALMRSRYSVFALGLDDYLWRTWHPRTRPERVVLVDSVWSGLEILDVVGGAGHDDEGTVEFVAHYRRGRNTGSIHERSTFQRRGRRWMYVDGVQPAVKSAIPRAPASPQTASHTLLPNAGEGCSRRGPQKR